MLAQRGLLLTFLHCVPERETKLNIYSYNYVNVRVFCQIAVKSRLVIFFTLLDGISLPAMLHNIDLVSCVAIQHQFH